MARRVAGDTGCKATVLSANLADLAPVPWTLRDDAAAPERLPSEIVVPVDKVANAAFGGRRGGAKPTRRPGKLCDLACHRQRRPDAMAPSYAPAPVYDAATSASTAHRGDNPSITAACGAANNHHEEEHTMSITSTRLAIGFAAGSLSHLVFQGAYGSLLHAANLLPMLPWSLMPVPPLGVPQTASLAFWAGLWGVGYAVLEPRLTAHFGRWLGALLLGAVALISHWFIAQPLKGFGIGGGFHAAMVAIEIGFAVVFGLGLAALFQVGLMLVRQPAQAVSRALQS